MKGRILFVATVDEHIRHFHLPYIEWLDEQGYEVDVATNGDESFPHCRRKYTIPFQRSPFSPDNPRAVRMLRKIAEENRYTLIHFHTPVASFFGRWATRKARTNGTRILYTAHGFHFFTGAPLKNWLLFYPAERLAARWTDALVTINEEDEHRAKRLCQTVYRIPGIGVRLEKFGCPPADPQTLRQLREEIGLPRDAFVVLSVGELIERKNHRTGLEAVAACGDKGIHYCIAGRGPLLSEFKQLACRLQIAEQVHFLGYRTDLPLVYQLADMVLFPSRQEGLPVALIEAMAAGVPCVASNVRGNADLLKGCGRLCDWDDPQDFARRILELRDHPQLRRQLAEAGRLESRQYSLEHAMEGMQKIYASLLPE